MEQDEQEQIEHQEQEQTEQQEQEQTEAVQQADDIRAREEEIAEALLSMAEAGLTREQGVQTGGSDEACANIGGRNTELWKRLDAETFSVWIIEGDDYLTKFYTGLPAWVIFLHLFMFLSPFILQPRALSLMDEFLLTLMRLRLNLMLEDLAYRFRVSSSTASRIFLKWLDLMYARLKFLVAWPSRDIMEENMPMVFKQLHVPSVLMHNRLFGNLH